MRVKFGSALRRTIPVTVRSAPVSGAPRPSGWNEPEGTAAVFFCCYAFLAFFAVVFLIYWSLPGGAAQQARVVLLVVASFSFYAMLEPAAGRHRLRLRHGRLRPRRPWTASPPRATPAVVAGSVLMNLGLLVYFKYANFFLQLRWKQAARRRRRPSSLPVLRVILPIGISFYTFEAINYTVDVYRRQVPAERNLAHFMLFIMFFPHLVAGPIVRARDFLPQIRRPQALELGRACTWAAQFFLMGLFKKMAIADRMALFADPVFANPAPLQHAALWLAVLAYALQIYCDFSGYTDMALGTAHMLGYKLAQNFNMPYLAANVSEFWRRWHISLSTWLRDYLFIPLGGSRGRRWQTDRNLLITMTLGGLWHGASWTFVVLGLTARAAADGHRGFQRFCVSAAAAGPAAADAARGRSAAFAFTFSVSFASPGCSSAARLSGEAIAMLRRMFMPPARPVAAA